MKVTDIFFGVLLALCLRGACRTVIEQIGEWDRIQFIESDTGCKVTRWSPGKARGCTPFNISNQEDNTTAWLCCAETVK